MAEVTTGRPELADVQAEPQPGTSRRSGGRRPSSRHPYRPLSRQPSPRHRTPGSRLGLPAVRALRGPALVVTVAAVLSAVTAVVLRALVFPHLSIDNDEPIYRLEAQALASGHLFPPAAAPADSYTPWLAVVRNGHYVLKYTPVVPGFHALSLALTGGFATGLAVLAAAGVAVTYLLGVEVLGDRRVAAVAAVLWSLSPLTIVQSALLLPYLPFVLLLELAVLGTLRGLRRGRRLPLVGAGLALGLAGAARAYDTVLFLLPLALWLMWTQRRRLGWALSGLLAGLAPPVLALLLFNRAATGSALKLPFSLLEPNDKLGFGIRQMYPTDHPHRFGIVQGLLGVGDHLWLLGTGWVAGGVLLAALAIVAVLRRRVERPAAVLGAGGLLLLVGYLAFWGAWNAAELWGGTRYVGPFYLMPVLVPLVLLGARGLTDLYAGARRWLQGVGVGVSLVGLGLVVATLVTALPADATMTGHDGGLNDLLASQGRSVVFLLSSPAFLQHPSAVIDNGLRPDGRTVFALVRGDDDFAVVRNHPGRSLRRLRVLGLYNSGPRARYVAWLEQVREVQGPGVALSLRARPPAGVTAFRVMFTVGTQRLSWSLDPTRTSRLQLRLGPTGPELVGQGPPRIETGPVPNQALKPEIESAGPGAVYVSLLAQRKNGPTRLVEQDRLAYRVVDGSTDVLAPDGLVARQGRLGDPALQLRLAP